MWLPSGDLMKTLKRRECAAVSVGEAAALDVLAVAGQEPVDVRVTGGAVEAAG
jgi:hypothetical protein